MYNLRTFAKKLLSFTVGTSLLLSLFANLAFAAAPNTSNLPDLAVTGIAKENGINSQMYLGVDITNLNNVAVPTEDAHTYIWVDGNLVYTYNWSTLADKNFLNAGGSSHITPLGFYGNSPLAAAGDHVVKVCVDVNNVVSESNETNNCYVDEFDNDPLEDENGDTISPAPYVQPPNFVIDRLFLDDTNRLSVEVRGAHPNPLSLNTQGYTYIWIDDMSNPKWTYPWNTLSDRDFLLGNGNHSMIQPQTLTGTHTVKACVDALNNVQETIESDNCVTKVLSSNSHDIVTCQAPYVYYNGSCTDPIPACANPPAHHMPSSCIDKIVNGRLIPRYNFQCEAGYTRSGNECVRITSTASRGSGLKFDVDLTSDPKGYLVEDGTAREMKVQKGDRIMFTREVDNKNAVNVTWDWNFEPMLDCTAYPDLDSSNLRCIVKKNGLSKVSITMFPVTADGVQHEINSNTIYVTTGTSNPTPTYTNSGGGGNGVQVPSTISTPPAGYEKEVQIGSASNPFSDTNISTRSGKAAAALYNMAIIGGFPDGEFKGNRPVNRAEAAKFLLLSRYETIPDNQNNGIFYDVLEGQWYTKYVITAAGLRIINGYNDRSFKPAQTVNTAEFLKMLTLTFDLETNGMHHFKDINSSAWYAQYAGTAYKYNLFPDRSNKLQPGRQLTRDEVAVAIYQYLSQR